MPCARWVASLCGLLLALPTWAAPPRKKSGKDEAAAISQVAARKHEAGDFPLCASLYHQAWRADPLFLGFLFSAARCEQKAGDLDASERDFKQFLNLSPDDEPLNEKARTFLGEIAEARKQLDAQKKAEEAQRKAEEKPPEPPILVKPLPPEPSRTVAWTTTVGGGALVLAGAALLASGFSQRSDLRDRLTSKDGKGLITDTTPQEAHDAEFDYRLRLGLGATCAALGVMAVGTGVWLFGRPQQVTLVPGPTAAGLGLQYAWQ